MPGTDQQIVESCQKGDPAAFEELVRRYGSSVLGYLTRVCGNRDRAEDCFQETFGRVYQNLHRVRPEAFRAWLFRIATNTAIDGFRKQSRVKMTSLDQTAEGEGLSAAKDVIVDPVPGPVEVASQEEQVTAVRRAVASLPDGQRAALMLAYYQQMSYSQVAEVLGCSVGAVKTQMSRALATLAERLPNLE